MLQYQILAITSGIIMVALDLTLRALQRERDQSWFLATLGSWVGGIVILPFIPYSTLALHPLTVTMLFLAGSLWGVSVFCDLKSHASLPVGVGALLSSLRTVILVAIGVVFFEEPFTAHFALGSTLIIAGVFISCPLRTDSDLRGILLRLTAVLASAVAIVTEKTLAQRTAIELIIVCGYVVPAIFYLIMKPKDWRKQCTVGSRKRTVFITLYTFLYAAIGPVFVVAFAFGELSETFIIFQGRIALLMLLGALLLKERADLPRRCLGMVAVLAGLYFVTG
jgi:drug/metabolite transporter (DMT)-like permease